MTKRKRHVTLEMLDMILLGDQTEGLRVLLDHKVEIVNLARIGAIAKHELEKLEKSSRVPK